MSFHTSETAESLFRKTLNLLKSLDEREARANTLLLVDEYFGLTMNDILMRKEVVLTNEEIQKLETAIRRILHHEPIQHILGYAYFYDSKLKVNKHTLIPRPETEELVELIKNRFDKHSPLSILDIGTGSGCIALSLAKIFPKSKVVGIDISNDALTVAKENLNNLKLSHVSFLQDDILYPKLTYPEFDIIVSNPPYIKPSESTHMEDNVLNHEPHQALFIPEDKPLLFYEHCVSFSEKHLKKGGEIFFEINEHHAKDYEMLLKADFERIEVHLDHQEKPRMVSARKKITK